MYHIIIRWTHPYPKDATYRLSASSAHTAVSRALRQWRSEEVKGKRIQAFKVECIHVPATIID